MLASQVFGTIVAMGLNAAAFYFFSRYYALTAEETKERNMDLTAWCQQYGAGVCS
jgi:hypothetical protein